MQLTATWHFSNKLNLRLMYQRVGFDAFPPFAGLMFRTRSDGQLSSLLLSYQINWQTRCYIGASASTERSDGLGQPPSDQRQIFAKISYAFLK